ncbi:MAG: endonuclease III, partial [Chloroflexi bacterium]|nr:endonuclease III [Chloroflexota bacterium]
MPRRKKHPAKRSKPRPAHPEALEGRAEQQLTPAEIVSRLAALYGEPEWRPHGDPMTELVLTILSQNTTDTNSGRAFMRLHKRFDSWDALAEAPVEEIEREIAVGGLAKQKAPRIKASLAAIREQRGSWDL